MSDFFLGDPNISLAKEYGLTVRQEHYCLAYLAHKDSEVRFNKTKSYQFAYQCSYRVANVNGPILHKKLKVLAYIGRLTRLRRINAGFDFDKENKCIQWSDKHFANNSYHWDKPYQPI